MEGENPFDKLVREDHYDQDKLADFLQKYIYIEADSGKIIATKEIQNLTVGGKMVLYFLVAKAEHELGLKESDTASPQEISDEFGLNANTVRSNLSRGVPFVYKTNKGNQYRIPNSQVEEAMDYLD